MKETKIRLRRHVKWTAHNVLTFLISNSLLHVNAFPYIYIWNVGVSPAQWSRCWWTINEQRWSVGSSLPSDANANGFCGFSQLKVTKDGVSEPQSRHVCGSYSVKGRPAEDFNPTIHHGSESTNTSSCIHAPTQGATTLITPLATTSPKAAAEDSEQGRKIKAPKMELLNLYWRLENIHLTGSWDCISCHINKDISAGFRGLTANYVLGNMN